MSDKVSARRVIYCLTQVRGDEVNDLAMNRLINKVEGFIEHNHNRKTGLIERSRVIEKIRIVNIGKQNEPTREAAIAAIENKEELQTLE